MLAAWKRMQEGEGQLLMLVGDPGVGKSRLISEVANRISDSAVRMARGRCLSYGQQISLWLIADVLRHLFGIRENEAPERVRERLMERLGSLLSKQDAETRDIARDVLGSVLGVPPGGSTVAQADAQVRRRFTIRSLRLVLGALSELAPTVLVLEDLHWMDAASAEVLTEILADVPGALLYRNRTGCPWRLLPTDFRNWNTVRYYFDHWTLDGTFVRINDALRRRGRLKVGREPEPSAGIIDSQSVKTTEAGGERGFDEGKKVTGRKRYSLVDTQGNLVTVVVHPANIADRDGADWVLEEASKKSSRLRHVWADSGYTGALVEWRQDEQGITIEIVGKQKGLRTFVVASRR